MAIATTGSSDVIIVGAGLAGLTAARALDAAGKKPVVVEARDRVGGRTFSTVVEGTVIDIGGQYVGDDHMLLRRAISDLGLHTVRTYDSGRTRLEFGERSSSYANDIPQLPIFALLQLQLALSRISRAAAQVPLESPWAAPRAAHWDALSVEAWYSRFIFGDTARAFLAHTIRMTFGADPSEMSLLHLLYWTASAGGLVHMAKVTGGGQQDHIVEGAQEIAKRLAAPLSDRVVLNSPVRRIAQSTEGVVVHTDSGEWRGQYAIVAIPPLLAGRIHYDPSLSTSRDGLTQRYPMGAAIKCVVLYERPFWRDAGFSGQAISDRGPVGFVLESRSAEAGGLCALAAFIEGMTAREWGARSAEDRRAAVLNDLVRLFGSQAGSPRAYVERDWTAEQWTGGCSAGIMPPGALSRFGPALRAPIDRLHWAGSETAIKFHGYMEGAIESGERAAREVLKQL